MIVVDNAILEIEPEEKELIWEAMMYFNFRCSAIAKTDHVAREVFKDWENMASRFLDKAYKPWGRKFH